MEQLFRQRAIDGVYKNQHVGEIARNAKELKENRIAPDFFARRQL